MLLLSAQPAPSSARDRVLTQRYLRSAQNAIEEMLLALRAEADMALGQIAPARTGSPYPYGRCLEITLDVHARLKKRIQQPDHRGAQAIQAFLNAGGQGRRVWGILRGQYFQNALQFGALYIDVANDTVVVTKPKVEILPMEDSGLEAVRDAWHFAEVAESYWNTRIYANHALPSLAPILPMIGAGPGKVPQLHYASDYMIELFQRDGFSRAEDWLARGPVPPASVVEALRARCPGDILHGNPVVGAEAAVASCRTARAGGMATSHTWRNACVADFQRIGRPPLSTPAITPP